MDSLLKYADTLIADTLALREVGRRALRKARLEAGKLRAHVLLRRVERAGAVHLQTETADRISADRGNPAAS